jgi:CHAT domain-containing protein
MTERCDDLDLFFDGELEAEAAQAFRDHLGACVRCQKALHGRMLEAAVAAADPGGHTAVESTPSQVRELVAVPEGEATPPTEPTSTAVDRGAVRARWQLFGASAAAVAAAIAVVMAVPGRSEPPQLAERHSPAPVAAPLALAKERSVEVRFSAPALDHYRPYVVMRAVGAASTEQIEDQDLAALKRRGELNTLVGAHALNGNLGSARSNAARLPDTAQSLADRAALELLQPDGATDPTGRSTHDAAAARALSLTTEALRRDRDLAPARWNKALALEALGLSLAAARVFDEIAASHEDGWSDEARVKVKRLRDDQQRRADEWSQLQNAADRMVLGGPVLTDDAVARAPSLARDAFYKAVATASTAERLAALGPLANALDARFTTTVLGDLLAHVRTSDLRARAPVAAELRGFLEQHKPVQAIDDLRAHAVLRGLRDIALASFLVVAEASTTDAHLAAFDKLVAGNRDPWWQIVALARHAFVAQFQHRDFPAVDAIARRAVPLCGVIRASWCGRIKVFAGDANNEMGRADLAIEQLTAARSQAKETATWNDEVAALHGLGQAIEGRIAEDIDSAAVAGAYLEEVALRKKTCALRLQRLDFIANAELQHHRFPEAAHALDEGDALKQGECSDADLRLNGETARVRLLLRGLASRDTVRANLAALEAEEQPNNRRLYLDWLSAAASLVEDHPRGEAALRRVLAASTDRQQPYAGKVRALAFDALVESAAKSNDATTVFELLTERLGTPRFERCMLGVASWSRLVVAVRDAGGRDALETLEIPAGAVMIPPSRVVALTLRARLAGCPRVDVVAPGPYFGAPGLLGDDVAWLYHAGTPRAPRGFDPGAELVVTDVTPPEDLHLPALRSFSGRNDTVVLSGPRATPDSVLAAMKTAGLIVIVAHGLTDADEPTAASLVLSPDERGDYLLTASKVSAAQLTGSPVVVLAGCDAGRVQVSAEPWSLATSFLAAGARVVLAPTEPIPDDSASVVFRSLVERIRAGADPVDALVAERNARGATASWLSSVVVFE